MSSPDSRFMRIESLILCHENDLRLFLRRYLQSEADIDDCCQETFLKVWKKGQDGQLRDDVRAYIFTTAVNVVRDKFRRDNTRQKLFHVELSDVAGDLRSREEEFDLYWKEGLRLIESELQNLRPSTRLVFLMHHVEHLSFVQIAERLGVTPRTAEREMGRAMEHLKNVLGGALDEIVND